jgi:putative two-component system response regulator
VSHAPPAGGLGGREPGPRVLCVDDEPLVLGLMTRLLETQNAYVRAVGSPREALVAFANDRFDLVITDIRMPRMDGHDLVAEIRARDPAVPILVATGQASVDTAMRSLREGATGMLLKPFTGEEFRTEVRAALDRSRIRHDALQYRFMTPILDGVALALTAAIEARDLETGEHCQQLGWMGERVAALMGCSEQERTTIRIGGYLHDVGKIAIADRLLLKADRLTEDEYAEMQRHAAIGGDIVSTHVAMAGIASVVRHHHERYDGLGYPDHLVGDAIPLGARIIAIADAISAMTNDRPYHRATSLDEAWAEVQRGSGRQFDPAVVEVYREVVGTDIVDAPAVTQGTTIAIVSRRPDGSPIDDRMVATLRPSRIASAPFAAPETSAPGPETSRSAR